MPMTWQVRSTYLLLKGSNRSFLLNTGCLDAAESCAQLLEYHDNLSKGWMRETLRDCGTLEKKCWCCRGKAKKRETRSTHNLASVAIR